MLWASLCQLIWCLKIPQIHLWILCLRSGLRHWHVLVALKKSLSLFNSSVPLLLKSHPLFSPSPHSPVLSITFSVLKPPHKHSVCSILIHYWAYKHYTAHRAKLFCLSYQFFTSQQSVAGRTAVRTSPEQIWNQGTFKSDILNVLSLTNGMG